MRLVINIPAFNEEKVIARTIQNLPRELPEFEEVIIQVIDDGSTDATVEKALSAGAHKVISSGLNRGLGSAFRGAVLQALESGADIMINIDADGQFNSADIPKLLAPVLNRKADIAIGSRFSGIKPQNMPFIRSFLNQLAAKLVGLFLGAKTADITCGFRAYNREALLRLNLTHQFTYTQETIIDALGKNLKLTWVPVAVTYFKNRKAKMTKHLSTFIFQSLMIIFKTIRDTKPLKFFGFPALFLLFVSGVIFVIFLVFYFQTFKITPFRNWLGAASVLLLVGGQLLVFAFLADMIRTSRKLAEDEMYEQRKQQYKK